MANAPNPTSCTSLSRRSPRPTADKTASTARSAAAQDVSLPSNLRTSSTSSALFMVGQVEGLERTNLPLNGQPHLLRSRRLRLKRWRDFAFSPFNHKFDQLAQRDGAIDTSF